MGLAQPSGKMRPPTTTNKPTAPLLARSSIAALQYTYVGRSSVTTVSPITGRQYRFDRPGAVQQVDARDRQWLERVPNVKLAVRRTS